MIAFRVPYGRDEAGRYVCPDLASKEAVYRCPGCESELVLRKGEILATHFGHYANAACSPEAVLERTARQLIVQRWGDGHAVPRLFRRCPKGCGTLDETPFPKDVKRIVLNHPLPSGDKAEVAALDDAGNTVLAIRIRAKGGGEQPIADVPWITVYANDVITPDAIWFLKADGLPAFACKTCAARQKQEGERISRQKLAQELRLEMQQRDSEHPLVRFKREELERRNAIEASYKSMMEDRANRLSSSVSSREAVGLWKSRGFELSLKMTACPSCRKDATIWIWPEEKPWGSVPAESTVPLTVKQIPDSILWMNYCASCNARLTEMPEESFA